MKELEYLGYLRHVVIQFEDGRYFAAKTSRDDHRTYCEDMNEAHKYINVTNALRCVERPDAVKKFKGALIVDLSSKEVIRQLKFFKYLIKNGVIVKETPKAYLINDKLWLPKSQVEIDYFTKEIRVSNFIWENTIKEQYPSGISENEVTIS